MLVELNVVEQRGKYYQFTAIDDCTQLRMLRIYPQLNQRPRSSSWTTFSGGHSSRSRSFRSITKQNTTRLFIAWRPGPADHQSLQYFPLFVDHQVIVGGISGSGFVKVTFRQAPAAPCCVAASWSSWAIHGPCAAATAAQAIPRGTNAAPAAPQTTVAAAANPPAPTVDLA